MLKHGSPKMISKVKQITQNVYKLFGLPMCSNESFYHDMQSDEVMCQTTQVIAIPSTRADINTMRR